MNSTEQTTKQQYTNFVEELKQCVSGQRGWVDCSKKRAATMNLAHANLTVAAQALGLVVKTHGRHGYCAGKEGV